MSVQTRMEAKQRGRVRKAESRAPCHPRSSHLPILSLHVQLGVKHVQLGVKWDIFMQAAPNE